MVQEKSARSYRASGALKNIEDQSAPCTSTSGSRSVDQATGGDLKLAAASPIELAAPHAGPENMQLGLTHRAFEPEQQPVVEAGWVVDAILVENKGGGQRA